MSSVTVCAARRLNVPRKIGRGAVAVASTVVVYVVILLAAGAAAVFGAGLMTSGAERLGPEASALADSVSAFGQDAAQVLDRIHTLAPWPLMALTLAWLAHRNQARYARTAFALLLSGAAGLAAFVSSHGFPESQTSLLRDYLALPGVVASWYVLMALAVATTVARPRVRATVLLVALSAVAWEVLSTDRHLLAALLAVATPAVAWFVAGVPARDGSRRGTAVRAAQAEAPEAEVVPLPSRAEAPGPWAGAAPVSVRRAG
ncbi:hypothetical protein [Streptomyces sp. NPDC096132]|uniref:hypothetical protein n=1 Tax=Streptomyces sp. NPDC096132 TaxID=3366075 RepID=UPI00381DAA5D